VSGSIAPVEAEDNATRDDRTRPVHVRPEPLAENRDFLVLLSAQAVSALGDAVSFTAVPLLVLALTGSGAAMGVVGALQTLPDLFVGLAAGAIADRSDRKRMMLLADLGRAVLTALIPISVLLGGPTMAILLIVVAPMSILRSFFLAGYTVSVPALVGRPQLARANSIFEAVYSVGYIIGPSFAGIASAAIGPGLTLGLDALSFLASSIGIAFIRRPLTSPGGARATRLRDDIREGIAFVAHHPVLRSAIAFWGCTSIVYAPITAAFAYRVTRELDAGDAALGLVFTAFGIGTVSGALLAGRLRRLPTGVLLFGGGAVMGVATVAASLSQLVPVLAVVTFIAGVGESLVLVTYITLRTAASPDALLGRIGSTARTISLGLQPIGLLAGGILIDRIGAGPTLTLIGAVVIGIAAAFSFVTPLRTAHVTSR